MAVAQPLTAFSARIDDDTLKGIDREAPRIREVHRALDACAAESGPQRYERALRAAPEGEEGAFYLMGVEPSPALAALFAAADDSRKRFSDQLALASDLKPPDGAVRIVTARPIACDPRAPMDVFLRMLERDEATSPSSLEGLFEDLAQAHRDGLIVLEANSLSLTEKGRATIRAAGAALAPLNDHAMRGINLHAQEVADGRLSLREAIYSLGADLGLELPVPGQPDTIDSAISLPDAGRRLDTALFDPLLQAVSQVSTRDRAAVATLALYMRLEDWGLSPEAARSILRHDIRCLRALGASLSHGPIEVETAQEVVVQENLRGVVDAAAAVITNALLKSLAGPKVTVPPAFNQDISLLEVTAEPRPVGLFRRLLSVFLSKSRG